MEFTKSLLKVQAYPNNYNIYIGKYFTNGLDSLLSRYLSKDSKVIVIYDKNLEDLYLLTLLKALNNNNINYNAIPLIAKETTKSFNEVYKILNTILDKNINRNSTIIALGGGIIGDISGFISSIALRGINYINIPTTLLATIDSSIGGKNGVNHKIGKNIIGTFYNPKTVIVDPTLLKTLNKRTFLSGFAEVIKCSLINNKQFFYYLYNNLNLATSYNNDFLNKIIIESINTKKLLVEQDFFDTNNQRTLLNLGHTFAHALESVNNYSSSLLHGEAVAIGLCMATKFSSYIGLLDNSKAIKIFDYIKKLNLPTNYRHLFKKDNIHEQIVQSMLKDKKNTTKDINLILLEDIGKASLVKNITTTKILDFLKEVYV